MRRSPRGYGGISCVPNTASFSLHFRNETDGREEPISAYQKILHCAIHRSFDACDNGDRKFHSVHRSRRRHNIHVLPRGQLRGNRGVHGRSFRERWMPNPVFWYRSIRRGVAGVRANGRLYDTRAGHPVTIATCSNISLDEIRMRNEVRCICARKIGIRNRRTCSDARGCVPIGLTWKAPQGTEIVGGRKSKPDKCAY